MLKCSCLQLSAWNSHTHTGSAQIPLHLWIHYEFIVLRCAEIFLLAIINKWLLLINMVPNNKCISGARIFIVYAVFPLSHGNVVQLSAPSFRFNGNVFISWPFNFDTDRQKIWTQHWLDRLRIVRLVGALAHNEKHFWWVFAVITVVNWCITA